MVVVVRVSVLPKQLDELVRVAITGTLKDCAQH